MSEKSGGLRFDVYERVHLPDDVAAIDELEEIELIPRIAVMDEGDQAILRGQLLLSGVYRSSEVHDGILALEHRIPVEISLPMHRVSRLDDISIDIDNFDVDILSARTLNVTGVLSLRGLLVDSVEEEQQWQEEVFTAVHENNGEQPLELQTDTERWEDQAETTEETEYQWQEEVEVETTAEAPSYIASETRDEQSVEGVYSNEINLEEQWQLQREEPYDQVVEVVQEDDAELVLTRNDEPEEEAEEYTTYATFVEPDYDDTLEQLEEERAEEQGFATAEAETVHSGWALLGTEATRIHEEDTEQAYEHDDEMEFAEEEISLPEYENAFEDRSPQAFEEESEIANEATMETWVETSGEIEEDEREEELVEDDEPTNVASTAPPANLNTTPHVAFHTKSADQSQENTNVGIRSLLGSSDREKALREAVIQQELDASNEQEHLAEQARQDDEVEWQSMFLGREKGQSFKKIRMCIVQKEETLEAIALRYNITPGVLQKHNQLHDSDVSEGQLLYIPATQLS
ncbi:LysM peptidoglycan-binding domain-containing protein [Paenibacillus yanchengensis]|uniref:LysM peptidoglycan-binding domain-containing protein n=1 Tax=Paenibacillus yanchengensis TaxID=2035833 RepID=A0ABW4YLK0_9BACL